MSFNGKLDSSSMTGSIMILRSSKFRTILYCFILLGMCSIVYLLSTTHHKLKETEEYNEKCKQQKDSLLAQMQVAFEQRNRIDKSLQQEKVECKKSKEDLSRKFTDLQKTFDKTKKDAESSYNTLMQEHQSIQDKQQQLETEIIQLKEMHTHLEDSKKQLTTDWSERLKILQQQKDTEITKLQNHLNELLVEKEQLQQNSISQAWQLKKQEEELSICKAGNNQQYPEPVGGHNHGELHDLKDKIENHSLPPVSKKELNQEEVPPHKVESMDRPKLADEPQKADKPIDRGILQQPFDNPVVKTTTTTHKPNLILPQLQPPNNEPQPVFHPPIQQNLPVLDAVPVAQPQEKINGALENKNNLVLQPPPQADQQEVSLKRGPQIVNDDIQDLPNLGMPLHPVGNQEKHQEVEDDENDNEQDGDNPEEQLLGGHGVGHALPNAQDADFEDQENDDENQKLSLSRKEGVMLSPK